MNLIETGIDKGLIKFDEERNFIKYIYQNKKRKYKNTEEKVQAETFFRKKNTAICFCSNGSRNKRG